MVEDMGDYQIIRGPCRVLCRPIIRGFREWDYIPKFRLDGDYRDYIDKHYEAIQGWKDIGATKSGITFNERYIKIPFAELTFERLTKLLSKNFDLVALWQDPELDKNEITGDIKHKEWHDVYYDHYYDPRSGDCIIPARFRIGPLHVEDRPHSDIPRMPL